MQIVGVSVAFLAIGVLVTLLLLNTQKEPVKKALVEQPKPKEIPIDFEQIKKDNAEHLQAAIDDALCTIKERSPSKFRDRLVFDPTPYKADGTKDWSIVTICMQWIDAVYKLGYAYDPRVVPKDEVTIPPKQDGIPRIDGEQTMDLTVGQITLYTRESAFLCGQTTTHPGHMCILSQHFKDNERRELLRLLNEELPEPPREVMGYSFRYKAVQEDDKTVSVKSEIYLPSFTVTKRVLSFPALTEAAIKSIELQLDQSTTDKKPRFSIYETDRMLNLEIVGSHGTVIVSDWYACLDYSYRVENNSLVAKLNPGNLHTNTDPLTFYIQSAERSIVWYVGPALKLGL